MKIVLADDSVLLRAGLARLLEDAGFEVAAQASDAEDLLRKVRAHKPAVAVTDIRMPPTQTDEGLRAAQQIRREMPEVGVMVLSQYIDEGYAVELLQGSAAGVGYLLKDRVADIDAFTDALRRVGDGGSVLDPEVVAQLLGRRRGGRSAGPPDAARARGARPDGAGALQRRDRPRARRHRARDREARDEHLLQARAVGGRGRPPPRARRADVPRRQLSRRLPRASSAARPPPGGSTCTRAPRPRWLRRRDPRASRTAPRDEFAGAGAV